MRKLIIPLIMFLVLVSLAYAVTITPATSCITMEEPCVDYCGGLPNMAIGAGAIDSVGGVHNKSGYVDGGSTDVCNSPTNNMGGQVNTSILWWINWTTFVDDKRIIDFVDPGVEFGFSTFTASNRIRYRTQGGTNYYFGNGSIANDIWYCMATTYNVDDGMRIYVNGVVNYTAPNLAGQTFGSGIADDMTIYNRDEGGTYTIIAAMDEVYIWANYTLTPAEVAILCDRDNPEAFWPFTEAAADTAPDPPTFVFPTPPDGKSNNTNQTINMSADATLRYFLWWDDETSPFNIVLHNSTENNWTTNITTAGTYYYRAAVYNITSSLYSTNTTERTFIFDPTSPTITIDPDNFFNTSNKSTVNQYLNGTVQFNMTFFDNDNVFAISVNVSLNGIPYFNFTNTSINERVHNFTRTEDITDWPEGVYDIEVVVADGHHYTGGYQIGDYKVSQSINKITFDTTEGNRISISGDSAYSTKYTREINSYSFGYDYFLPSSSRSFSIESDNKIYYIPKSRYKAHFVIWNGEHGNWVDFEGLEGNYEVERINDYKYRITFSGSYGTEAITRSIGGLNVVTENYQWYRGTFTNTNPELLTLTSGIFVLNLTIDNSFITNINATLIYNNTFQEVTRTIGTTYVSFNTTVVAPEVTQDANVSFFWNVTVNQTWDSTYNFLIERNNSVENWGLDNCSLYTTHSINFTLQDETNQSFVNGDVSGTFNYTRDNINFRTFDLSIKNRNNFSICITPGDETFTVDYDLIYSATNYQQRDFERIGDVLTNATVKIPLYLLLNSKGVFQRFTVTDAFSNTLGDVRVRMSRTIGGTVRTVEVKLTDDSGFARFWANPDETYTFTFSKTGFETKSFSLVPDSSEIRVVVMGEAEAAAFISVGTGIRYSFSPINTILSNNTNYTFMFNMSSSFFKITGCTLFLKNSSGNTLDQSSTSFSTTHCNIAILRNTGNLSFIKSEAKYTLNETINETLSVEYTIRFTEKGEFSLMNFIDDLKDFGELGFDDFTRMFIAFIVIFAIVGTAAFRFGLREPETLTILTWSLVLFFSYLGWLTLGFDAIPDVNPPGKAWIQQYIIFIVFTLVAGGYLIKKHSD